MAVLGQGDNYSDLPPHSVFLSNQSGNQNKVIFSFSFDSLSPMVDRKFLHLKEFLEENKVERLRFFLASELFDFKRTQMGHTHSFLWLSTAL